MAPAAPSRGTWGQILQRNNATRPEERDSNPEQRFRAE
jgi:hypothetical protein